MAYSKVEEAIQQILGNNGVTVVYIQEYFDGFEIGLETELDAYKAAYVYRKDGETHVRRLLHQAAKYAMTFKREINNGTL